MTIIEGVPYYRFRVRWTTYSGKRRQRTIISPGLPWVSSEVRRMLDDICDVDEARNVYVRKLD